MSEIVWTDPPPRINRRGELSAFLLVLEGRPGDWAIYPHPYSAASAIYRNQYKHPGTEWRAVRRLDGQWDGYARWVGAA